MNTAVNAWKLSQRLIQVLHDNLLAFQEGKENNQYHSLGNIAPHVHHIDSLLKVKPENHEPTAHFRASQF